MEQATNNMLTVKEVADYFRVDLNTIYRAVWSKRLGAVRIGGTWRIPRPDFEAFCAVVAKQGQQGPSPRG